MGGESGDDAGRRDEPDEPLQRERAAQRTAETVSRALADSGRAFRRPAVKRRLTLQPGTHRPPAFHPSSRFWPYIAALARG